MPVRSVFLLIFWLSLYYAPLLALLWRRRSDATRGPRPVLIFLLLTFTGWMIIGWFAAWYLVFPSWRRVSPRRSHRRCPAVPGQRQGISRACVRSAVAQAE